MLRRQQEQPHFWDVRLAKYQERLLASRERCRELAMQRRRQAVGLPAHGWA